MPKPHIKYKTISSSRSRDICYESFKLDQPFLVMATQNPVEQEGTYQLPEAQLDRFMLLNRWAINLA
jgi:MoxR-like ATPase